MLFWRVKLEHGAQDIPPKTYYFMINYVVVTIMSILPENLRDASCSPGILTSLIIPSISPITATCFSLNLSKTRAIWLVRPGPDRRSLFKHWFKTLVPGVKYVSGGVCQLASTRLQVLGFQVPGFSCHFSASTKINCR